MTGKIKILVNIIFPVTGPTNSLFPVKPRNAITFALPVPAGWQFSNVWELAEERYRKNYAVGQNDDWVFKKLHDMNDADIAMDDTVEDILANDEIKGIKVIMAANDREDSVPVGSNLRPVSYKRCASPTQVERAKRRKLQIERYGDVVEELDPNTPIGSLERDLASNERGEAPVIDNSFKVPRLPARHARTSETAYAPASSATEIAESVMGDFSSARSEQIERDDATQIGADQTALVSPEIATTNQSFHQHLDQSSVVEERDRHTSDEEEHSDQEEIDQESVAPIRDLQPSTEQFRDSQQPRNINITPPSPGKVNEAITVRPTATPSVSSSARHDTTPWLPADTDMLTSAMAIDASPAEIRELCFPGRSEADIQRKTKIIQNNHPTTIARKRLKLDASDTTTWMQQDIAQLSHFVQLKKSAVFVKERYYPMRSLESIMKIMSRVRRGHEEIDTIGRATERVADPKRQQSRDSVLPAHERSHSNEQFTFDEEALLTACRLEGVDMRWIAREHFPNRTYNEVKTKAANLYHSLKRIAEKGQKSKDEEGIFSSSQASTSLKEAILDTMPPKHLDRVRHMQAHVRQDQITMNHDRAEEHAAKTKEHQAATEQIRKTREARIKKEEQIARLKAAEAQKTKQEDLVQRRMSVDVPNQQRYNAECARWEKQRELDRQEGRPSPPAPERPLGSSLGTEIAISQEALAPRQKGPTPRPQVPARTSTQLLPESRDKSPSVIEIPIAQATLTPGKKTQTSAPAATQQTPAAPKTSASRKKVQTPAPRAAARTFTQEVPGKGSTIAPQHAGTQSNTAKGKKAQTPAVQRSPVTSRRSVLFHHETGAGADASSPPKSSPVENRKIAPTGTPKRRLSPEVIIITPPKKRKTSAEKNIATTTPKQAVSSPASNKSTLLKNGVASRRGDNLGKSLGTSTTGLFAKATTVQPASPGSSPPFAATASAVTPAVVTYSHKTKQTTLPYKRDKGKANAPLQTKTPPATSKPFATPSTKSKGRTPTTPSSKVFLKPRKAPSVESIEEIETIEVSSDSSSSYHDSDLDDGALSNAVDRSSQLQRPSSIINIDDEAPFQAIDRSSQLQRSSSIKHNEGIRNKNGRSDNVDNEDAVIEHDAILKNFGMQRLPDLVPERQRAAISTLDHIYNKTLPYDVTVNQVSTHSGKRGIITTTKTQKDLDAQIYREIEHANSMSSDRKNNTTNGTFIGMNELEDDAMNDDYDDGMNDDMAEADDASDSSSVSSSGLRKAASARLAHDRALEEEAREKHDARGDRLWNRELAERAHEEEVARSKLPKKLRPFVEDEESADEEIERCEESSMEFYNKLPAPAASSNERATRATRAKTPYLGLDGATDEYEPHSSPPQLIGHRSFGQAVRAVISSVNTADLAPPFPSSGKVRSPTPTPRKEVSASGTREASAQVTPENAPKKSSATSVATQGPEGLLHKAVWSHNQKVLQADHDAGRAKLNPAQVSDTPANKPPPSTAPAAMTSMGPPAPKTPSKLVDKQIVSPEIPATTGKRASSKIAASTTPRASAKAPATTGKPVLARARPSSINRFTLPDTSIPHAVLPNGRFPDGEKRSDFMEQLFKVKPYVPKFEPPKPKGPMIGPTNKPVDMNKLSVRYGGLRHESEEDDDSESDSGSD